MLVSEFVQVDKYTIFKKFIYKLILIPNSNKPKKINVTFLLFIHNSIPNKDIFMKFTIIVYLTIVYDVLVVFCSYT